MHTKVVAIKKKSVTNDTTLCRIDLGLLATSVIGMIRFHQNLTYEGYNNNNLFDSVERTVFHV